MLSSNKKELAFREHRDRSQYTDHDRPITVDSSWQTYPDRSIMVDHGGQIMVDRSW